jgi:hypothetical protein
MSTVLTHHKYLPNYQLKSPQKPLLQPVVQIHLPSHQHATLKIHLPTYHQKADFALFQQQTHSPIDQVHEKAEKHSD